MFFLSHSIPPQGFAPEAGRRSSSSSEPSAVLNPYKHLLRSLSPCTSSLTLDIYLQAGSDVFLPAENPVYCLVLTPSRRQPRKDVSGSDTRALAHIQEPHENMTESLFCAGLQLASIPLSIFFFEWKCKERECLLSKQALTSLMQTG